jgi:hypothetical protein
MANAVIPANSNIGETGRTDHAQLAYPWYARTSLEPNRGSGAENAARSSAHEAAEVESASLRLIHNKRGTFQH